MTARLVTVVDRRAVPAWACMPHTAALAIGVAGILLAAIAVVAVLVRVTGGAAVREWLAYPFTGVPATTGEAGVIFAHNTRALLGVLGLLLIAQVAAHQPDGPGRAQKAVRIAGETVLAGIVAANVFVVGAALGAYGPRMVRAVLPHGPVELAGFATAIALYLQGRHRALPTRQLLLTSAVSVLLLAMAALLEALVVV
jgi:hypothetical protein